MEQPNPEKLTHIAELLLIGANKMDSCDLQNSLYASACQILDYLLNPTCVLSTPECSSIEGVVRFSKSAKEILEG